MLGFLAVGVSKQRGPLGPQLSPFLLATPVAFQAFATSDGTPTGRPLPLRPLELVWQAAKATKAELLPEQKPSAAYFRRRARIYDQGQVKRRYVASGDIGGAVLSWRTRAAVGYVASRKFYCKAYAQAVKGSKAYRFLESLCREGHSES